MLRTCCMITFKLVLFHCCWTVGRVQDFLVERQVWLWFFLRFDLEKLGEKLVLNPISELLVCLKKPVDCRRFMD